MSNSFLEATAIAREAILALENNLVFANLVHRDFESEFKNQGDDVAVKIPSTFTANTFSTTATAQNITESSVIVTLDTIKTVDVEITSKQMTMNIEDFARDVVNPAAYALANAVDSDIAALAKKIGYVTGAAGTTASGLANIASVGKVLNNAAVPYNMRRLIMNPDAHASLITLDAIAGADKSGSTDALREASMGRILGFDTYMSQNIAAMATADITIGDTLVAATALAGATSLTLLATALTGTFAVGTKIVSTALSTTHVVVSAITTVTGSNQVTVSIHPALPAAVATGTVFTVVAAHDCNIGFHKNAFALVTRPLALPFGGARGAIMNYNGLSIRVTYDYTMASKSNVISFDILYGVKILDAKKACVMYG